MTFLAVAKADEATPDYNPFERLDDVVAAYAEVLAKLAEAGAPWVQIDEHALASDNLHVERATLIEYSTRVFAALAKLEKRPAIFAAIGYGDWICAAVLFPRPAQLTCPRSLWLLALLMVVTSGEPIWIARSLASMQPRP